MGQNNRKPPVSITDKNNMTDDITIPPELEPERRPSHIIGIGASAGGLEAIESFFKAMPADAGVAFVVIQHLSPDHKSLMVELLSKRTAMPVHRAEDGIAVEKNSVYLIPPNKNLRLFHGHLLVTDQNRDTRGINLPIDVFLSSLAEDQGNKAIAIILSGTGSDGTNGIRAIKEDLGMAMVQSEETAGFDGMPRSAISTGLVDFVLPPEAMPKQLLSYVKHPYTSKHEFSSGLLSNDDGLTAIFALLRERHKIDFTFYKPSTIVRRIERRMAVNQIHELNDYVRYLESFPTELTALHKDLLIGVTSFFRDPDAFALLREQLVKRVFPNAQEGKLRIWVAGCSSGEEAYSIAILCREVMEAQNVHLDIKIFATDVDRDAVLDASGGAYPESVLTSIDPALISKYFVPQDDGFRVARQVREMVVFAQHNLVKDPPFTNIDLISCRNLLIYLQPVLQRRVLELFNFSLNAEGILFLGSSETTGDMSEYFESLDQKWRLYRSLGRRRHAELSQPAVNFDSNRWRGRNQYAARSGASRMNEEERLLDRFLLGVAGDYLPFSMIVNESLELLHVVGDSSEFLHFPAGKVVNDVTKLAIRDLAIPLSTGLQKVFKNKDELTYSNIHLRDEGDEQVVNMRLKPIPAKKGQAKLVAVFVELAKSQHIDSTDASENYDVDRDARQRINDLENELQYTRENLQATVEELETSNEELQATNEELLASNEELQSTNEELQSVNEELYTVNAEYQSKITELTEANNDLDNLLANSCVGTVFLDENLDIRRFTPDAVKVLRLMNQDVGRPLSHVAHEIPGLDLIDLAEKVQQESKPREQTIVLSTGEKYLLRILPYQIAPKVYSGVVITFIPINGIQN